MNNLDLSLKTLKIFTPEIPMKYKKKAKILRNLKKLKMYYLLVYQTHAKLLQAVMKNEFCSFYHSPVTTGANVYCATSKIETPRVFYVF